MSKRKKVKHTASILIFFFLLLIVTSILCTEKVFGSVSVEQLLFHLYMPIEGIGAEILKRYAHRSVLPSVFFTFIYAVFSTGMYKKSTFLKKHLSNPFERYFKFIEKHTLLISILLCIVALTYVSYKLGVVTFIKNRSEQTLVYNNYYIDPSKVKLTFPEKKQNLIFIFLESMESTYNSVKNGGGFKEDYTPELLALAKENVNFSQNNYVGGSRQVFGTGFTMGAMVSYTCGIPLKLPFSDGNAHDKFKYFLPNVTCLGDILKNNGYRLLLVIGSDKKFSGKDTFFRTHGNFEIKDRDYYEEKTGTALLGQWGFDDQHTYSFAKEELKSLASQKGPFCMFMETVDTHTPSSNAFIPSTCEEPYKDHYANALACASKQVKDFVDWIKAQSFYKDTTIIIVGDHLNMDNAVFTDADLSFGRRPLNIFINSKARTENFKNRDFTTLDMFPSILASIGVKIEGDRVGLGQSLFGNNKTLLEQKGYDWLNNELSKSSKMYDHFLY